MNLPSSPRTPFAAPLAVLAALTTLALAAPAAADSTGDKLLADIDAALHRAKTLVADYDVVDQEVGKAARASSFTRSSQGDKTLIAFGSPADMKGTKLLILSATQMYVYLPAFGKVRRIAPHGAGQGFLGLTFSEEDLGSPSYAGDYQATVVSEDAASWKLSLTPRPGKTPTFAKVELTASKDHSVPTELRYFDVSGKNTRTETRSGYTCEADVCTAGALVMTDTTSGHWTKLVRKSWKVNPPLGDSLFTRAALEAP